MQKIARELNLAETAFVLPATREDCAAFKGTHIYAGKGNGFAGHPTIGTAFLVWQQKMASRSIREFGLEESRTCAGSNRRRPAAAYLVSYASPVHEGSVLTQRSAPRSVGTWCARSPSHGIANVERRESDSRCCRERQNDPSRSCVAGSSADETSAGRGAGTILRLPVYDDPDGTYSRMFAPDYGIPEDPASGSCMGPLAVS